MEQNPRETNNLSEIQEIPRLLWNPRFYYTKFPVISHLLNYVKRIHTLPPHHFKIHLIISSLLHLGFSSSLFLLRLRSKILCHFSFIPGVIHAHPSHIPCFDHLNMIWRRKQIMMFLIMQSPPHNIYFLPLRSRYSLVTLLSGTLKLFPTLTIKEKISYPIQKDR
jgi:hypothetical protein